MTPFTFPTTSPEALGIPSSAVLRFIQAVERKHIELHSFMLVRHGAVAAQGWWQPYAPELPHMLFSLSKSFTSSAIGMAVAEGRLTVDDKVISFFPDDLPETVSDNLAAMRVRHLLSMATGHAVDSTSKLTSFTNAIQTVDWVKTFLSLPVENVPGAPFVYNSGATYMLSAIVQKLTGMTLLEYLTPRLFEPLGIENPTWESCPKGINTGGWGLSIRTEDIARFGQLYLQKGLWNGERILPEAWIAEATSKQVPNGDDPVSDWAQGYGYQFWRCRHNAYRGDGAFGQYCIVMPDQDAVLAITSGIKDMQVVLDLVWKYLLPEMKPAVLRANRAGREKLAGKLAGLALPVGQEAFPSGVAAQVSGKQYQIKKHMLGIKAARFDFVDGGCTLTLAGPAGEMRVEASSSGWKEGATRLFTRFGEEAPVLANGIWVDENVYRLVLRFNRTPFHWTLRCVFNPDTVAVYIETNVSFGPTKPPRLWGRMG
jgi:CubicO group peptidase (beta-lactamase class C family)